MLRRSSKISQRLVRRQQQPNQIINRGSEKLPHKGEKTMEDNINKIIDLGHQKVDNYNYELISLMILENRKKNSFSDYELIEARRRLQELADAISYQLDED